MYRPARVALWARKRTIYARPLNQDAYMRALARQVLLGPCNRMMPPHGPSENTSNARMARQDASALNYPR